MSLSKPFRLSRLPLVALENVLLQTEPRDLLVFALSVEKARKLIGKCSLAEYLDISVKHFKITFTFCLKSGKQMEWIVGMLCDGWKYGDPTSYFELDDMRMFLCEKENGVVSEIPRNYFLDYTQRIGYFLQSIFPCQRIRNLGAGKVEWEDERDPFYTDETPSCEKFNNFFDDEDDFLEILDKTGVKWKIPLKLDRFENSKEVLFYMDRITSCEKFRFLGYDGDNLLEILGKTDVKRKITLVFKQDSDPNLEWMNNEKIRNISRLKLVHVRNLSDEQILSLDNEHLHLEGCEVNKSVLNAFLKKWMNGEFTKRRTLRVTCNYGNGFYERVFNGLTPEPVKMWKKLGKPGHVRFSNKLYLNPIPSAVNSFYRTDLLRNCHGQLATVVQTYHKFYFTTWDLPIPPINIPAGYKLHESSHWPFIQVYSERMF